MASYRRARAILKFVCCLHLMRMRRCRGQPAHAASDTRAVRTRQRRCCHGVIQTGNGSTYRSRCYGRLCRRASLPTSQILPIYVHFSHLTERRTVAVKLCADILQCVVFHLFVLSHMFHVFFQFFSHFCCIRRD